jgi:hypothetical protein
MAVLVVQAEAARKAALSLLPKFDWGNQVICDNCGEHVSMAKCRVTGKQGDHKWRCSACSVTHVQMRRVFGSWPTDEFSGFSEDTLVSCVAGSVVVCNCPPHVRLGPTVEGRA